MSFDIVEVTAASAVATSGTLTVPYPTGKAAASYPAYGHKAWVDGLQSLLTVGNGFTLTFGASNITFTYTGSTTIPAGSRVNVQLNLAGADDRSIAQQLPSTLDNATLSNLLIVNLGAPIAADANGYVESQNLTSAGVFSVNTTAAAALAAAALDGTADVPRNVVAAWTGTAVLTVTGTDEYGNVVVESSGSGTSLAGKKAFKTVTDISVSANVTSLTVGTGDVLGLPVFLGKTGYVIKELEDGTAPTAGTLVAGVSTTATATTGDVRGTYDPNSAANGSKVFELITAVPDITYLGVAQYAG
jgi:hypothetical protein